MFAAVVVAAKEVCEALPGDHLPPRGPLLLSHEGRLKFLNLPLHCHLLCCRSGPDPHEFSGC